MFWAILGHEIVPSLFIRKLEFMTSQSDIFPELYVILIQFYIPKGKYHTTLQKSDIVIKMYKWHFSIKISRFLCFLFKYINFFPGSILAVTLADKFAPGKTSRFLGLCIYRGDQGLHHKIILRNVIDNEGVSKLF